MVAFWSRTSNKHTDRIIFVFFVLFEVFKYWINKGFVLETNDFIVGIIIKFNYFVVGIKTQKTIYKAKEVLNYLGTMQ